MGNYLKYFIFWSKLNFQNTRNNLQIDFNNFDMKSTDKKTVNKSTN